MRKSEFTYYALSIWPRWPADGNDDRVFLGYPAIWDVAHPDHVISFSRQQYVLIWKTKAKPAADKDTNRSNLGVGQTRGFDVSGQVDAPLNFHISGRPGILGVLNETTDKPTLVARPIDHRIAVDHSRLHEVFLLVLSAEC